MSIRERLKERSKLMTELMDKSQRQVVEMHLELKEKWDKASWQAEMDEQDRLTLAALQAECDLLRAHVHEQEKIIDRLRKALGDTRG